MYRAKSLSTVREIGYLKKANGINAVNKFPAYRRGLPVEQDRFSRELYLVYYVQWICNKQIM